MLTLCRFETKENLSDENILKKQGFISNVFKNLIEKDVGKKNTVLQVNKKNN
jgi:capsule polysaccharide modification protein KpsS